MPTKTAVASPDPESTPPTIAEALAETSVTLLAAARKLEDYLLDFAPEDRDVRVVDTRDALEIVAMTVSLAGDALAAEEHEWLELRSRAFMPGNSAFQPLPSMIDGGGLKAGER